MNDTHGHTGKGWIGVDLDGTLAVYHGWVGPSHIGAPIDRMVMRVDKWLESGIDVRIVTARVAPGKADRAECIKAIDQWCEEVFGRTLPLTHEKDQHMLELWDDRAVQLIPNSGLRADRLWSRILFPMERFFASLSLAFMSKHDPVARLIRCQYNLHDYCDWEHGKPEHMTEQPCVRCGVKFSI